MSELERIVESDSSDLAAHLVRAAARERPSAEGRQRALHAALGAGGALGAATLAAGQTSAASSVKLMALKWIGLGVVLGTVVSAGVVAVKPSGDVEQPRVLFSAPHPASDTNAVSSSGVQVDLPPETVAETEAQALTPPSKTAKRVEATAKPAASDQLGEEVMALDRARGLVDRDPAAALRALDDHSGRFKRPALGPEASVLRIEALARAGRRDEAARAAREFLSRHPDGALAARVRRHAE